MLCIRAEGDQIAKPVVIFRGQGIRMTDEEIEKLNSLTNIRWYFQKKAWADGEFCQWWLKSFKEDLVAAGVEDEVLLGLDGLKAQNNQPFWDLCCKLQVLPVYTTPDCTDVVAPCDHHIFVRLKNLMKKAYKIFSQHNRTLWTEDNELSASKKWLLVAQWLSAAWETICDGSDCEEYIKLDF